MEQGDLQPQNSDAARGGEERMAVPAGTAQQATEDSGEANRDTLDRAKSAAANAVSSVSLSVKQVLDRQVGSGADMAGRLARSARSVAADLDHEAPQVAGVVRGIADRIDDYAEGLRGQSVDQLVSTAADFTRRQPALVLGLAALTGFFAVRVVMAAPPFSLAGGQGDGARGRDGD
jgi:16S rRNA G966 N2-methylase RsmD